MEVEWEGLVSWKEGNFHSSERQKQRASPHRKGRGDKPGWQTCPSFLSVSFMVLRLLSTLYAPW